MTNQELIDRIRKCRPSDLSDGMDAIGLVNQGSMDSKINPIRPGISMAGFAYTVKLVPAKEKVKICEDYAEYLKELGKWCDDTYSFSAGISDGKGKDMVVVIDMQGYPGGIWGSNIAMYAMKNGVAGTVIDGGCRDIFECNMEKAKIWFSTRTFNHVYGRLKNGGVNVPIKCGGVKVNPGDIVCGDDDGILVIPRDRAEEVLKFALPILNDDQKSRAAHYKDLGLPYDTTLGNFKP